jgi:tRNA (guanine-N7-)-methyltransferase
MTAACAAEPRLAGGSIDTSDQVHDRVEDRPVTRFERRGLAEGRTAIDLRYQRVR